MNHGEQTYEFGCTRKKETEKAILVLDPATGEEIWFPLSQVFEMHFDKSTHHGTIVVSHWIAVQKGLTK